MVDKLPISLKTPEERVQREFPAHLFTHHRRQGLIVGVTPRDDLDESMLDASDQRRLRVVRWLIVRNKLVHKTLDAVEQELGVDGLRALADEAMKRARGRGESVKQEWKERGLLSKS